MSTPKKTRGLYARLMGDFHSHPKVLGLSLEAVGLWAVLASWSAHARNDGYFSPRQLAGLAAGRPYKKPFAELLSVRLVDHVEGGDFRLHGWDEHNMTRAEHDTYKEEGRVRKAAERQAQRVGRGGSVPADSGRTPGGLPPESHGHGHDPLLKTLDAKRAVKGISLGEARPGPRLVARFPFGSDEDPS